MIYKKKVVVVMPAYNAAKTLKKTYDEIDRKIVDDIILVDDASRDETARLAKKLKLQTIVHPKNRGYGGNQKTCYAAALQLKADIVIMLHPDYQYDPKLIPAMAYMLGSGLYDTVLASRILGGQALQGGMPLYKYISNRFLTFTQNVLMGAKLSEYHTGYRAFTRKVLESIPMDKNSDDFIFDNQMLVQAIAFGFRVGEISCPAKYFAEASSIRFGRAVAYGLGVLWTSLQYRAWRAGIARPAIFAAEPRLRIRPQASDSTAR